MQNVIQRGEMDAGHASRLPVRDHEREENPPRGRWRMELAWTLPFLVFYWVNLAHHELWRDELNAWTIAVVSPTLRQLFHLVHYEAHPWLW